jgi:hypothetical protein
MMFSRTGHTWRPVLGAMLLLSFVVLFPSVCHAGPAPEAIMLPDRTTVVPNSPQDSPHFSPWGTAGSGSVGLAGEPAPAAAAAPYCTELVRNGSFETGTFMYWSTSGSPSVVMGGYDGLQMAQLGGRNHANDRVYQVIPCPFYAETLGYAFTVGMQTEEVGSGAYDCLTVRFASINGSENVGQICNNVSQVGGIPFFVPLWSHVACPPGGTYEVSFAATTDADLPTWFWVDAVSLVPCCRDDPYEPNDTFATAVTGQSLYQVILCPQGDEDWFRFEASAGQRIRLYLWMQDGGEGTVCLVSPQGTEKACDSEVYPGSAIVEYVADSSGWWRARVHDPAYSTRGQRLQLSIEVGVAPPTPTRTSTPTATSVPPPSTATPTWTSTGVPPPPTVTATRTATGLPPPTSTRTPTATVPGTVRRVYLPLVLKRFWSPRPEDCTELVVNGGFESGGLANWSLWGDVGLGSGRSSANGAWLGGRNNAEGELWQWMTIPAGASVVPWGFWWKAEVANEQPDDMVFVYIQGAEPGPRLLTLRADGALNEWRHEVVDLSPYAGQGFFLTFRVHTDGSVPTTFRIDDVSVQSCFRP